MAIDAAEREDRIRRYGEGAARLRAAVDRVPLEARQWRPGPGKWSAHEIVVHCADAETNGAARIRYLLAEDQALIVGYDQDAWARHLDYHQHPLEPALATVEAVRGNTLALLRRVSEEAWDRVGRHTEAGTYTAADWLRMYSEHLEGHSAQIERTFAAWAQRAGHV